MGKMGEGGYLTAGSIGLAMVKDGDTRIYSHASISRLSPMSKENFCRLNMAYFEQVQGVKCRTKAMRHEKKAFFLEEDVVIVSLEDPECIYAGQSAAASVRAYFKWVNVECLKGHKCEDLEEDIMPSSLIDQDTRLLMYKLIPQTTGVNSLSLNPRTIPITTPGMFLLLGEVLRKALHATSHQRAFPEEIRVHIPIDILTDAIAGFLLACDWFELNMIHCAYEHMLEKGHSALTPFGNYIFVNAKYLHVFTAQDYRSEEWNEENFVFYDFIRKWAFRFRLVSSASRDKARSEAILHCKPSFMLSCEVSRILSLNPELIFKDPHSFLKSARENTSIQFLHMYSGDFVSDLFFHNKKLWRTF